VTQGSIVLAQGEPPLARAIAVVGQTASGKSALALELARALALPIFCCDSVQIYRGLDIGSAKPGASERALVRHELLDLVDPDVAFSAHDWARSFAEHAARGPGIVCGGTGFYLRTAFAAIVVPDGADDPKKRDAFERAWLEREAARAGAIHGALAERDQESAAAIHPQNVRRALRALHLCECAGEPISAFRRRNKPVMSLELLMILVDPGIDLVDRAIDARCDRMIAAGFVAEVESLRARGYHAGHRAMRSLGYRQLLDHLEGRLDLAAAVSAIKIDTRHYARRQRTFFRRQFPELRSAGTMIEVGSRADVDALVTRARAFLSEAGR
jgi:tRNA dimethylallyltransferase